jgi:hypothetical protein
VFGKDYDGKEFDFDRDFSTLKWYIIPLLCIVFYVYMKEVNKAKRTHNWDPVFAALAVFGLDFIPGLILHTIVL